MKNILPAVALVLGLSFLLGGCRKHNDPIDEYAITDTTGVLKNEAAFPVGVGVRFEPFSTDTAYLSLLKKHFNSVTFENELKHASIVSNEGVYNYSKSDEFVNLAQAAGLSVYGHSLVGYRNSNNIYLRSLTSTTTEVNTIANPGFESGSGNNFTNWTTQVSPGATGSFTAETASVYEGSRALKADVTIPGPFQYSMQAYTDEFSLSPGYAYTISFYAKAAVHGSKFKAIIQNNTYQEKTFFLTQTWEKYSWTFTVNESTLRFKLHFPYEGSFYFDKVSLPKPVSGVNMLDPVKIDSAMKKFIATKVSR